VALFGSALWVFGEQLAAGLGTAPLEPGARRRAAVVTGIGGVAVLWLALGSPRVAHVDRWFAALVGLLLLLPALIALGKLVPRGRAAPAERAPRRVRHERHVPPLPASHTRVIGPAPRAPDLDLQRRRWRRRG
jgi:hypothetical protein